MSTFVIHDQSRLPLAVVLGTHVKNQALIRDTDFQKIRKTSQLDRSGCHSSRKGLDGWRFLKLLTQNKPSSRQESQNDQSLTKSGQRTWHADNDSQSLGMLSFPETNGMT